MSQPINQLFKFFDKDADGYLNFTEMSALASATSGSSFSEDDFNSVCGALNCDPAIGMDVGTLQQSYDMGCGSVSDDFVKVFTPYMDQMFDRYDQDGDGFLNQSELSTFAGRTGPGLDAIAYQMACGAFGVDPSVGFNKPQFYQSYLGGAGDVMDDFAAAM
eukprot:gnl/Spiro4/24219_TR12026_c0_g1_i1.p1 gnl/Spiro4/24219_TR12026_c0_g1~~gnl/Spiro4/24219_TR12026_c0_g1_i1.p1  ORF type:complete len:173 (+),score=48.47 gnl/Spiro4/24219_TR12026_c0_g1_i1:38-520(+)